MDNITIHRALTASGYCEECGGKGSVPDRFDHNSRNDTCGDCGGTGFNRLATLKAIQAVGRLVEKLIELIDKK